MVRLFLRSIDVPTNHIELSRRAQATCGLAALLWVASTALLALASQLTSYTVCEGSLFQFQRPSVHIPPQSHNLWLIHLQHTTAVLAIGATIIGAYLALYADRERGAFNKTTWLLATVAGSLMLGGLLWLAGEYYLLRAHLDAVTQCL